MTKLFEIAGQPDREACVAELLKDAHLAVPFLKTGESPREHMLKHADSVAQSLKRFGDVRSVEITTSCVGGKWTHVTLTARFDHTEFNWYLKELPRD